MVGFLKEGVAGRDGGRMRKEEEEKKVELERGRNSGTRREIGGIGERKSWRKRERASWR